MAAFPAGSPLLLHVCCAPCASTAIQRLGGHFALTLYYYNPNTQPFAEYQKRLDAFAPLLQNLQTAYPLCLETGPYEEERFLQRATPLASQPEGGARCEACFSLRLEKTAQRAAQGGFGLFATSLTVGPRKNAAQINNIGAALAQQYGPGWLSADFKKKDGYRQSVQLSQNLGLYRQSWCGCSFSRDHSTE